MTLKNDAKFEEKPIYCFKSDKNLENFDRSNQKFQKFALWLVPSSKVYNVWPKKVQRKSHAKFLRKTDLWSGKWHEEFGKFSPEHLKVSKLGLWWDPFVQSRKCMSLKFTEELCVMTMKNDAKFEEELTCHFKIDMRNLTNFDPSTQNY